MDVTIKFVLPKEVSDETECNKDMLECFELCGQNDLKPIWIKETQCDDFTWEKHDVVIFQSFEGDAFDNLSKKKCVVLGPRFLLACFKMGLSIPNRLPPIFMYGMVDFTITCTGFTVAQKKRIKQKVEYMGAVYDSMLTVHTTHLITNNVRSAKHIKACEIKIPIMLEAWVEAVWEENLTNIVSGDAKQFDKYRCPIFHNLNITSTGFTSERKDIIDLVNGHGGVYSGKFRSESTTLLIYSDTQTDKFKAAKISNIDCVTIDWLKDSVKSGYALPIDKYAYKKTLSSTLICSSDSSHQPDFSLMSSKIMNEDDISIRSVSETVQNIKDISTVSQRRTEIREPTETSSDHIINSIDLKQVKKADIFLDGCSVYLSGFTGQQRDKLCKVLNSGGATRYDVISDRVTHVIVGNEKTDDAVQFEARGLNPIFVSVQWLVECIKLKRIAPEHEFKISHNRLENLSTNLLSSPLSKKGVQLLQSKPSTINETADPNAGDVTMEVDVMQQYLTRNEGNTDDTLNKFLAGGHFQSKRAEEKEAFTTGSEFHVTTSKDKRPSERSDSDSRSVAANVDDDESVTMTDVTVCNLFVGLSFYLLNWNDVESKTQTVDAIEAQGGTIVSDIDSCDHVVVMHSIPVDAFDDRFINELWFEECIYSGERVPIKYYHRPVRIKADVKPLAGLVICISRYSAYERMFLQWLINHLGAVSQENLARKGSVQKKNTVPSTHLLCSEPTGSKYDAAKKWGVHVVSSRWIVACEQKQSYVSEDDYAVGKSVDNTIAELPPPIPNAVDNRKSEASETSGIADIRDTTLTRSTRETSNDGSVAFAVPTRNAEKDTPSRAETSVRTPKNEAVRKNSSQMTPVAKFLEGLGVVSNALNTPESPMPLSPDHIDTPETPLGRVFGNPNPSPATRKYWARKINSLVPYPYRHYTPPPQPPVTPLPEIMRRYWRRVLPAECFANEDDASKTITETENTESTNNATTPSVNNQLQELKDMLTKGEGNKTCRRSLLRNDMAPIHFSEDYAASNGIDIKSSQTDTIGWEEPLEKVADMEVDVPDQKVYKFMFSQISTQDRTILTERVMALGALISDTPNSFDDTATHLLCVVPTRNEKLLSSIASGKWVVHVSFIDHCTRTGKFDNEETYEYGNPSAVPPVKKFSDGNSAQLVAAVFRWRKRIFETGRRAYHGMRAIVLVSANRRDPIVRLIEAGGGVIVDPPRPYTDLSGATHCFIEGKRLAEFPHAEEIAKAGVPCLPHLYLSDYLLLDPPPDPRKCIIEPFQGFYK